MSKGRVIAGRYRLSRRLGRGSFGVVWEGEELLAGEPVASVAVKIFTAEVDRREIALLAGLSHPSILTYRAVVEDEDDVCLVTELADGGDAAGRLKDWPDGLPAPDVRDVIRAVADALVHMHGQGWIHRDVKPANILFVRGAAKLGDVGTARALTSTAKATSTASLAYAAPEFFSGKTGPAVDTYALGCTVFELLTGRLPFNGTMAELVHQHMTAPVVFPSDMPGDLAELIRGCTVKEPERRWPLAAVLEAVRPGANARAETQPEREPQAPPRPPSKPVPPKQAEAKAETNSQPAKPQSAPRSEPASPKKKNKPTALDPALRRHLRQHGKRWGDADAWRAFMQTAGSVAKEQGLSERELIRRAGQLLPEIEAATLSEQEEIARVGAWVAALGGPKWSAPDWADLLDQINARDEAALARVRDALLTRIYPRGAGATRALDFGGGVSHLMVFTPIQKLHRPTTVVLEAVRAAGGAMETTVGIWHSANPITVQEWSTLAGRPAPQGLKLDNAAGASKNVADALLAAVQRRFPLDELRWPMTLEYDGIKWGREQAAAKVAMAAQRANPGAVQRQPPQRQRPKTLGAAVLQTIGKAAADMVREMNEAWLADIHTGDRGANKRLIMNLVSPVPKVR